MSSVVSPKLTAVFCLITFFLLFFSPSFSAYAEENPQTVITVTDDKAFPPFAFLDAEGNPRGITIDIWNLWSKKTGIPVKFDLMEWNEALKAVREGRADALGGLFLTPERKAYYDYTKEIITIPTAIFFYHQIAGIKGLEDLSGFRVGVIKGDSSEELLRTEHPDTHLVVYASTDELVRAAIAGQVRVFLADAPVALFYLAKYPGGAAFRKSTRDIALNLQYSAVKKGNRQLLAAVQSGFDKISKAEINAIVGDWSGQSTNIVIPWREIGIGLSAILIIIAAVFVWNIQLHRRVLSATRNLEEQNKELQLSREAIRDSEARYRELVENANSIILRMDKEGRILFFNEFALRFFGFRQDEILDKSVVGTIVPEKETTGRDLAAMIRDIGQNPDVYVRNENENMRSNGERVWVAWSNKAIYGADGEVTEILCIGNDITERKRAEEIIKQSEERFSKAFQSSPAPLVISEIDTGRFIDVNDAWIKMLGYTKEEQIGRTSREIGIWMNPEDRDRIVEKLRLQGSFKDEPIVFIAKSGQHVQALWSAEMIALGPKQVMLSMLYDETERKQAEQQIIEYNQLLHSILASSPVGIGKIENRRIVWANDTLCRISGYAEEELQNLDSCLFYENVEEYERVGKFLYEKGHVNTRLVSKDGTVKDALVQIAPSNSPSYIFSVVDITQQKKDAQELAFFKFVLDHARDSLLSVTLDARIIYANESALQSLAYPMDELLTMHVWDIDPCHPQGKWTDFLTEIRRQHSLIFESTHQKKDGTLFPVEISANLYRYYGEEYVFAFIRDITLRKQMTEELAKAQGLLNAAFMQSPSGILIADAPDVRIKMANPAALGIRGSEKHHLVDIDIALHSIHWQTFYPDGRPLPPEELPLSRAVLKGETCQNVEVIIRNEHGEDRWVSANAAPVRDQEGHIIAGIVIFRDITESKHMETALRQSEEKFKTIFEESPFSIILNDLQTGQFIDVNRAYADMYLSHLKKDFIIGKTALEIGLLVDTADNKRLREGLDNTGRVDFEEVRVVDANGVNHVLLLSSRIIEIGGRKQVLTTLQDITERKKMEEALRTSLIEIEKAALRYEALIAASNTGAWEYNNDTGFLWCSPEYFSILGRDIADFDLSGGRNIDQTWLALLHHEDRQRAATQFSVYLKNPSGMYEQYFRMLHQDGSWRWIWSRGKTLTDNDGNLTSITVGTHIDITPNKNLEEGLKWLSAVIEQADEEVIITDPEGTIQYINPAFERVTGYSKQEALGQNQRLLKSGVHEESFYEQLWQTITSGHVWSGRIINKRKDGKLIHEDAIISPLFSTEGLCTGYASLKRDVTDRINLENQLRQAQKMEAIGTMAGGIAHDFNNILGSIMGYTELAMIKASDVEIERYLDQVLKASDRAKALVAQILTFSRQSSQEKRPLSVTPIFKEVLKLLRSSLPANIQIRQHFACPVDTVFADPTQIYQVLMNLCANAAHAMREDGGILGINLEPEHLPNPNVNYEYNLKDGPYLKLTVRDNGCGMEQATIEHIFEPFFTTKKEGEGTGLGLSVVYGIVKDHGGSIHVSSLPKQGTTFTILLPLIEEDAVLREEGAVPLTKGRGHILLVDDEEALAQMGREMLTSLGYEVTLHCSSLDTLDTFRKNPHQFDLVITDMTMPNMSGAMLAREMLKIRHDLPIIMVTGFSERINEEDAKGIGIRDFLMKPVSLADLSQTIMKILKPEITLKE